MTIRHLDLIFKVEKSDIKRQKYMTRANDDFEIKALNK
jgi:hypothetical protein